MRGELTHSRTLQIEVLNPRIRLYDVIVDEDTGWSLVYSVSQDGNSATWRCFVRDDGPGQALMYVPGFPGGSFKTSQKTDKV